MYGTKKTRLLRIEARRRPAAAIVVDRSPWDWYAESCSCGLPPGVCRAHPRARTSQRPPAGDWRVWSYVAGRGAGKTRAGACWIQSRAQAGIMKLGCLIAPTAADIRDVMVEGPSGLLAVAPPWCRPRFEPSKRRVTWPDGARAVCLSGEEPERVRGFNVDTLWADELACWQRAESTWDLAIPRPLRHRRRHVAAHRGRVFPGPPQQWLGTAPRDRVWRLPRLGRGEPAECLRDQGAGRSAPLSRQDRPRAVGPGRDGSIVTGAGGLLRVRAGVWLAVRRPLAAAPGFGRARDDRPAAGKRQPRDPPAVHAAEGRLSDVQPPAPRRRVDRLPGRRPSRRRHDRCAPRRHPRRLPRGLGATAQPPSGSRCEGPRLPPRLSWPVGVDDPSHPAVVTCEDAKVELCLVFRRPRFQLDSSKFPASVLENRASLEARFDQSVSQDPARGEMPRSRARSPWPRDWPRSHTKRARPPAPGYRQDLLPAERPSAPCSVHRSRVQRAARASDWSPPKPKPGRTDRSFAVPVQNCRDGSLARARALQASIGARVERGASATE